MTCHEEAEYWINKLENKETKILDGIDVIEEANGDEIEDETEVELSDEIEDGNDDIYDKFNDEFDDENEDDIGIMNPKSDIKTRHANEEQNYFSKASDMWVYESINNHQVTRLENNQFAYTYINKPFCCNAYFDSNTDETDI
ncbi:hypothetical protein NPIL_231771 [Nephila pilipes]|uniref:Uncharacterized protein n=1 Tax=Nephila pilipes TaxID=299642 RepID=A0A8X6MYK2_NEPPI|nr:hypothetical protein NPIL_231771 [Nephila pilipes]